MSNRWGVPAGVWLLGAVSLLNDVASEAIYPLLPFFLTTVLGATVVSLGVIEGAADAVSSILKLLSGYVSDRWKRRKPIVVFGYSLSGMARPFIAFANGWWMVFTLRFIDRVGKGIRTAPRDAMLAEFAHVSNRGKVYGLHRAMDHTGAVVGPVLAWLFLLAFPDRYRTLFTLTVIPGLATVLLLLWVREPSPGSPIQNQQSRIPNPQSLVSNPDKFQRQGLMRYFVVLSVFTLGNSADAFLLLHLTQAVGGPPLIPLFWSLLHVVKMAASLIGGPASDRFGRRGLIAVGWLIYAAVYAGFAFATAMWSLVSWFLLYGVYYGAVEGSERALVADLAHPVQRGITFGIYNAITGIGALISSVVFGLIWTAFGARSAFLTGATLALVASVLLFVLVPAPSDNSRYETYPGDQ